MKIVNAFDSFKGCMTAIEACHVAQAGILQAFPQAQVINLPMSDGGEGLVDCLSQVLPVQMRRVQVHGPLHDPVIAQYAISKQPATAYMEMAQAAGLTLVPPERRNPMLTTTYGVGEMILDAVANNCNRIIIGIGGSATCDGGKGMVDFFRDKGLLNNDGKVKFAHDVEIIIASDVNNPLCGINGAAHVFAPQKGATPQQVEQLDRQLYQFALQTASNGTAPLELMERPGAGAAGGLGFGLMAYTNATMRSGIDLVLDTLDFDRCISGADLVITGEGKSDRQTLMGKVAAGVLARALSQGIPCALLSGQIEDRAALLSAGFTSVSSIHESDPRPLSELMQKSVSMNNLAASIQALLKK